MKKGLCSFCVVILAICAGCRSSPLKLLNEVVKVPPGIWLLDSSIDSKYGELRKAFEVTQRHYRKIYDGLKILRATLFLKRNDLVFEIQTNGDIELARKAYGKSMQFHITFFRQHPRVPNLHIFTVGSLKEAMFLSGNFGILKIFVDENGKGVSAKQESNYKVEAKLKLEIDRDCMRIYLPLKCIPKNAKKWWPKDLRDLEWFVTAGLALPPLKPIPTNLPDVYFVPDVHQVLHAKDDSIYPILRKWCSIPASKVSQQQNLHGKSKSNKDKHKN